MHWLGLLCLLGAAVIVSRWYRRRDSLGRRRAFPWISTVALILVGLGFCTPWS